MSGSAEKDTGRVRPSVLRQVIAEAMDRAEAAGMDRRTTEEWIGIEILASPLIPLTTEAPLRMAEVESEQSSWFQQEYERSKKRNEALGGHGMVVTGTGFDVPTRVTPDIDGYCTCHGDERGATRDCGIGEHRIEGLRRRALPPIERGQADA